MESTPGKVWYMIFVSEVFVVAGASSLAADGWTGGLPGEGHRRWSFVCRQKSWGERQAGLPSEGQSVGVFEQHGGVDNGMGEAP